MKKSVIIDSREAGEEAVLGNDIGEQYRSGIYYSDEPDRRIIETSLRGLQERTEKPVVVECKPLENFWLVGGRVPSEISGEEPGRLLPYPPVRCSKEAETADVEAALGSH
jgi:hypothetical protein